MKAPFYGTVGSAGLDLCWNPTDASEARIVIDPGQLATLNTGVAVEIPPGYFGSLKPRSSVRVTGLLIEGVIDADYRGEIVMCVLNASREKIGVMAGQRIAQLLILPVAHAQIEVVTELGPSVRGAKGFGSTG